MRSFTLCVVFALAVALCCADDTKAKEIQTQPSQQQQQQPQVVADVKETKPTNVVGVNAPQPQQQPEQPQPQQQPDQPQQPVGVDGSFVLGSAGSAIAAIHSQQIASSVIGNSFLALHSAVTWSQVVNSWATQSLHEDKKNKNNNVDLEENNDFEDETTRFIDNVFCAARISSSYCKNGQEQNANGYFGSFEQNGEEEGAKVQDLEEAFPYSLVKHAVQTQDQKKQEVEGEKHVTYLTKLWHITAANRLADAQKSHYQTKIQLAMLQQVAGNAGGNALITQLMYLTYYKDILNTIASSVAIEKQDSWSRWVLLDILESTTSAEENSEFLNKLVDSQYSSMKLLHYEALLDVQIMYIDFLIHSLINSAAAQQPQPQPQPQQGFASFVEMESTANPEKPFIGFGAGNPAYFQQYLSFLRMYSKYLFVSATQYLHWSAHLDLVSTTKPHETKKSDKYGEYSVTLFTRLGLPLLYSWAQANLMLSYVDMFQLYTGMYQQRMMHMRMAGAFSNANANNAFFVQTEAPEVPKIENENIVA